MIIPALDLIDGKVVRLHQGDYAKQRDYDDNPLTSANNMKKMAQKITSLSGFNKCKRSFCSPNFTTKKSLLFVNVPQVGGGIRTRR